MKTRARALTRTILNAMGLLGPTRRIACELYTLRQNLLSAEEMKRIYRKNYHENAGYGKAYPTSSAWEPDEVIKLEHAKAILSVLRLKKVLVGGCSSGMAVLAFRRLGVETWGFDISPDLEQIVLPEVRAFVRHGSMTAIPFDSKDNFDILVTTDVLEHIQLKSIGQMMSEITRLGTPWMAHLINHIARTPDHMTLKPLKWWMKKFAQYNYVLRTDLKTPISNNPRIYGLNGDLDHVYTFWQRRDA